MKKKFYYHVFLSDDFGTWSSIVTEQFKLMEDHYLTDVLDEVHINCIYISDIARDAFTALANIYFKNPSITYYKNTIGSDNSSDYESKLNTNISLTENITLKQIYDDSQKEDFNILYVHSKGVTSVGRCLKQLRVEDHLKYFYWRQYLNWAVIENWKSCVDAIDDGYDLSSSNFMLNPYPHISGNMWWGKSSYIRTLPDPTDVTWYKQMQEASGDWGFRTAALRFRDEMWVTCSNTFKINLIETVEVENNPAYKIVPRRNYVKSI